MEITSSSLLSNYAEAHQLNTNDLEYPNILEMQHPDLNSKKLLVFIPIFFRNQLVLIKI